METLHNNSKNNHFKKHHHETAAKKKQAQTDTITHYRYRSELDKDASYG